MPGSLDDELLKKLQRRRNVVDSEGSVIISQPEPSVADVRGDDWLLMDAVVEDWELMESAPSASDGSAASAAAAEIEDLNALAQRLRALDREQGHAMLRTLPEKTRRELQLMLTAGTLQLPAVGASASARSEVPSAAAAAQPALAPESNPAVASVRAKWSELASGAAPLAPSAATPASTQQAPALVPALVPAPAPALGRAEERERVERERAECAADCALRWPRLLLKDGGGVAMPPEESATKAPVLLEESDLRVLRADVARTRGSDPAFQAPEIRERLERLLVTFCENEHINYLQGLHEVAAVFLFVQTTAPEGSFDDATALSCLAAFAKRFTPFFHDGDSFVALHVSLLFFRQLIMYHHPDLHNYFSEAGVSPFVYATPWFITLFAARTPLSVLLRFWDCYITRNNPMFLHFLAVALLAEEKAGILSVDPEDAHGAVTRIGIKSNERLNAIWEGAEALQARTPKSLPLRLSRVLDAVAQRRGLSAAAERPWSERVIERVEKEGSFLMLPEEVAVQLVRAQKANATQRLQLLLLDVRSRDDFLAESLPQAVHFHPACLARLVASSRHREKSRLEKLAASLSAAVSGDGGTAGAPATAAVALGTVVSTCDQVLVAEVFDELRIVADERWGEGWNTASRGLHLVLLGDAGAAAVALYEALTEHLALARVSVAMGGAAAVHREATKRGVKLDVDQAAPGAQSASFTEDSKSLFGLGSAWSRLQAAATSEAAPRGFGDFVKSGREAALSLAAKTAEGVSKVKDEAGKRASEGVSAVLAQIEKLDAAPENVWACQAWVEAVPMDASEDPSQPRVRLVPSTLRLTDDGAELRVEESVAIVGPAGGELIISFEVFRLQRIGSTPKKPDVLSFYFGTAAEASARQDRKRPSLVARFSSSDRARDCARAVAAAAAPAARRVGAQPGVVSGGSAAAAGYTAVAATAAAEEARANAEDAAFASVTAVRLDEDVENFLGELDALAATK